LYLSLGRSASRTWLACPAVLILGLARISQAAANHGNQRLEVTPEVSSNPTGSSQTLTATLYQGNTNTRSI
jgi:hypothetical protein